MALVAVTRAGRQQPQYQDRLPVSLSSVRAEAFQISKACAHYLLRASWGGSQSPHPPPPIASCNLNCASSPRTYFPHNIASPRADIGLDRPEVPPLYFHMPSLTRTRLSPSAFTAIYSELAGCGTIQGKLRRQPPLIQAHPAHHV
ncbi:uncharacterized protein BCR38DRAFT_475593 [Pseudomassariella vexata]|uniref:Uncharacterized protein n=1 Tax=Pseudomassariella vexata TaxID=1141098 RepID=A0A1Y2DSN5_9PEZI|nr:uncharacterized protein BCR38DRAFT_475593 [Pseudomassariella vexata]ORY62169.1 hypothetical protein BCR38DRAFT_475593 [Pseudomassariella vexata]